MRIVSQDKMFSFDVGNTSLMCQQGCIFARQIGDQSSTNIGVYGSQERANEVFEDIHKSYCGLNSIVFQNIDVSDDLIAEMRKNPKPIIVRTEKDNQKVEMLPTVYYMPEE